MICVNCTFMPVEVLPPLHTGLINGQQLSVSNMVPSFSRGELFAIKSYWLSILSTTQPLQLHHWHQPAKSILSDLE